MSLKQAISQLMEQMGKQVPPQMMEEVGMLIQRLVQEQVGHHAKGVGDLAPNFSLTNSRGVTIDLTGQLRQGPVVLTFYRGEWCPFCDLSLRALQNIALDIHARGASLLAISPQTREQSRATGNSRSLTFDLLSDPGNQVARTYGLVFGLHPKEQELHTQMNAKLPAFNGDESWELPVPAAYVIAPDGRIVWRFLDPNFTNRAEPTDMLAALDTCLRGSSTSSG